MAVETKLKPQRSQRILQRTQRRQTTTGPTFA